ncbi:inner nuclear membrane protein Man1 [Planococcus citri]|uniref:inner nuclear membrane protein Man1 n=1 Tax=Planococcus citri TaxID=170843 RepID=UPI0031F74ED8
MSSKSDQELRQRLIALGYNPPPVTDSTRGLLLTKLQKLESSVRPSNSSSNPPSNSSSNPPLNSSSNPPSNPPSNNINDIDRLEARTRKTRSTKTQESPEKIEYKSFSTDKSPARQTRSRTEENNYDKVDSTASIKKSKTSTPFNETFSSRDPFERGSDSDDSVSHSGRPTLARKPLGVRRESQYYINRSPTSVYRNFDADNGAASYLNRDIYRPKSTSSLSWYQKLNKKLSNSFNKITPSWIPVGFVLFFVVVAGIYFSKNDRQYGDLLLDDVKYLKCHDRSTSQEPCIPDEEVEGSLKCLKTLYQELWKIEASQVCGARTTALKKHYLTPENFTELLVSEKYLLRYEAGKMLSNVKTLAKRNPQIGIVYEKAEGFRLEKVELPWKCVFASFFFDLYEYVSYVVLTVLFLYSTHLLVRWGLSYREKNAKDKADLLKGIVEILQQISITNPSQPFLPIVHVRDQLINNKDREKKRKMWAEAVKHIEENESRIRKEVQPYQGEDYEVWRWVGGHQLSLPKPKTWHGEAFETSKDTMNTPSTSPTPCLKIRNMFDPKNESDNEDWITRVEDAILERCEGVKVIHIAVDGTNPEGCVYVKCASTDDAGKAYRKMHGAWFDGKIVSVKYLRLERYHERYPASVGLTKSLSPSNDQKKSII